VSPLHEKTGAIATTELFLYFVSLNSVAAWRV